MSDIDTIIARVRAFARRHGNMSKLARAAGVSRATLAGRIYDDDWNPTASMLRTLDSTVAQLSAATPANEHQQA